jgi:hypothetical protein
MWLLAKWLALSVPAVYTNSMIKYAIAIAITTRSTVWCDVKHSSHAQ